MKRGQNAKLWVEGDGFEIAGGIRRHVGTARKGLGLMTEATFKRVPSCRRFCDWKSGRDRAH